jgi:hypothetical protein
MIRLQPDPTPTSLPDSDMPWLSEALDPVRAAAVLGWHLPPLQGRPLRVRQARLLRRKPGRRAVVAWDVEFLDGRGPPGTLALVGKCRARGLDVRTWRLQRALSESGLAPDSPDGLSVPAPVGLLPPWSAWVQARVPGSSLEDRILSLDPRPGAALMPRVAELLHKLHRAGVPATRTHTRTDELRILASRLKPVLEARPELAPALSRLFRASVRLARGLPEGPRAGVHRDFHLAQVMVSGRGLHLLDLDLHASSEVALDVGNFTAHLTELALRTRGDARAFAPLEEAFRSRALALEPELDPRALEAWHLLALVRLVGLSVTRPGRAHTTDRLVELCEEGLEGAVSPRPRSARRQRPRTPAPRTRAAGAWLVALLALGAPGLAAQTGSSTPHTLNAGADVSSVYDSNVNRDRANPQGIAGLIATGILRHRYDGFLDLRSEYEVGIHRYNTDTPWNRISHKLRVDARREAGDRGTAAFVTELQIRGSGDDRSLGDQLQFEPSYTWEPTRGTEVELRAVTRLRRDRNSDQGETNLFVDAEISRALGSATELSLGGRFERNRSDDGQRDFHGPRARIELEQELGSRDVVSVELEYRERSYRSRMVDTEDQGEALRHDTRLTPTVAWERDFGNWFQLLFEYEYEARRSNDPDRNLGGHAVLLGVRVLR